MAGVSDRELAPVGPFPVGIDNLNEQGSLQRSDDGKRVIALRDAVNCDIPRSGWPRRRGGYGQIVAGTRVHSLWHGGALPFMLFAAGADQYAMRKGQAPFVVRSGLAQREVSYAIPNDRVYASNGAQAWCVYADGTAGAWGVETPVGQPVCSRIDGGGFFAGRHQVAITYIDVRGEESGTGVAAVVDLKDGDGIALADIPQPLDADVARIRVYVSAANGAELKQIRDLSVGQSSATIATGPLARPLATQFLEPMGPGHIVRYFAGRIYVADGKMQRWSEALRYGLTKRADNYRGIGGFITMQEPVGDGGDGAGIFVADEKRTYWVEGADPAQQRIRPVYQYGAVPGTAAQVPGSLFGFETKIPVAYWLAKNGVACVGLPGGSVVTLRDQNAVAPKAERGATLVRERDGLRSIVTALRGSSAQPLAVRDLPRARVYRNDIEI